MLGKLLNLTSGAVGATSSAQTPSSRPSAALDSVQEDIHTRNLLFPDAHALYEHRHDQVFPMSSSTALPTSAANAFDYSSDLEIESRDVRVIIMQDTLSSVPASLLYDSHAPPSTPLPSPSGEGPMSTSGLSHQSLQEARRGQPAQRKISLSQSSRPVVIQQQGSPQPRQGAFDRRGSMHGRSQSRVETEGQRATREYGEEIATFSGCIFGNNEFLAYKGTSTKVHVVPSDPRHELSGAAVGDGRGSIGRSSTRSSRLAQSFSSDMVSPFNPPTSGSGSRGVDRKKVLITRLFPVNLPGDAPAGTPQGHCFDDGPGYPFPYHGDDAKAKPKKLQPKQKRTPMYAVALVISLPPSQSCPTPASRSTFRGPSSYTEQDSFPSSYSSARRAGWTLIGQGGGLDAFDSPYSLDVEDRIDAITRHWDIIMRTLTHLQSVAATHLFTLLKQVDMGSPDPFPSSLVSTLSRTPSLPRRQSEEAGYFKPPKTNTKYVSLLPNCLADDRQIRAEVDSARSRIVSGLRATRVVTGQNRWGIWRDEARHIARWGGGRDQGFFFFDLLTGFLSVHTDWLQALSPSKYRRQYLHQQKAKNEEDLSLPVRTIIVGPDKALARRLVFLLSAFLPANQQLSSTRAHRPSTSASVGAFSQSPPSYIVPILKEESLRRKINRRAAPRQYTHSRHTSMQVPGARSSIPAHLSHLSMDHRHERRASDAASIRTTNLPILGSEVGLRKTSAATTTITPETTLPHFSTLQRLDSPSYARPGSSGSAAADDLKRTLTRGDSAGHYSAASTDSRQSSRWGSVISGLWSARRRDSTQMTAQSRDSVVSADDSSPASPGKASVPREDALGRMVQEAQLSQSPAQDARPARKPAAPQTPRQFPEDRRGGDPADGRGAAPAPADRTPDPSGAFESPVKTTINLDDGVIDVDVPFPDYITSFETAVSSPSSSGYLSTPGLGGGGGGLDAFEQQCRAAAAADGDAPMNVAGWLQRYHPDFALQAIPPQADLMDQVRASLRAEPSPPAAAPAAAAPGSPGGGSSSSDHHHHQQEERWVDVGCALVADTAAFAITLVRYRRLLRPRPPADPLAPPGGSSSSSAAAAAATAATTPSVSPYERMLDDEFVEEAVVSLDEGLTDAVERVIAQPPGGGGVGGGDPGGGGGSTAASSRSTSKRRPSLDSSSAAAGATESESSSQVLQVPLPLPLPPAEVPRSECKAVVLSALEAIVKQELEERQKGGGGRGPQGRESILRQAVRAWLEAVEAGSE